MVRWAFNGVGRFPWSMRWAKHVGLHNESWRESWDGRYRGILGLLDEVEGRALRAFGRRL